MRDLLGALGFSQKGMSIKAVRFIDKLAVRVRVDNDRAGIDAFRDAQFLDGFQDIPRALDINALALACVSDADFIPARDMKDAIHALHWLAQALFLCHIALVNPHTRPKLSAGLGGISRENHHSVSSFKPLPDRPTTDKAARARDTG